VSESEDECKRVLKTAVTTEYVLCTRKLMAVYISLVYVILRL